MGERPTEGRYANVFSIGYDAFVFVIDFGQHYIEGQEPDVHSRIVTSPPYAKVLLGTLRESLTRYERTYGAITEPERTGGTPSTERPGRELESLPLLEHEEGMTMPERPAPPQPGKYPEPSVSPRYGNGESSRPDVGGDYGGNDLAEPPAFPPARSYPPEPPKPYGTASAAYGTAGGAPGYGPPAQGPAGQEPSGQEYGGRERQGSEPPYQGRPPEPPPYRASGGGYADQSGASYSGHAHGGQQDPNQLYGEPTYGTESTGTEQPGTPPRSGYEQASGQGETSGGGKPGAQEKPCPKPEDQLKELQRSLDSQNKQIETLEKQRDSLKDDLTGLQQTVSELATILKAYKDACKSLNQQRSELELYLQTKTSMVDAAVGDKKGAVEECIRCIDEWIESWTRYAEYLERKAESLAEAASESAKAATDAQATYDDLKNSAKTLDERLKTLKALRDQIEQEDDNNKICRMYFLLKELKAGLAEAQLRTPEELEHELCLAWTELSHAKEAARTAKAAADAAREQADRANTKATDAKTKRRDLVLECVDRVCPPPKPKDPCC